LRWRETGLLFLLVALLGSLAASAQPRPRELRLLQRIPLPQVGSIATDVRWADDHSVYVSWVHHGIAQVGLDGNVLRTLAPGAREMGLNNFIHLASSPGKLAVGAAVRSIAWRNVQAKAGGSFIFHQNDFSEVYDFDLFGDRVLLMGLARYDGSYAPKGEIAWIGRLSEEKELKGLRPVLHDVKGPGAPHLRGCRTYRLGGVRFLADGSFVAAPGFQDGVHLFNAAGRRVRSWSNEQIGVDTHVRCAEMTKADEEKLGTDDAYLEKWVKNLRVIDDILPLPQGPGLLVRTGKDGRVHWSLKVLQPEGIETYAVPVVGSRTHDRLHGDVRKGKIVLLLSKSGNPYRVETPGDLNADLLVMELPNR